MSIYSLFIKIEPFLHVVKIFFYDMRRRIIYFDHLTKFTLDSRLLKVYVIVKRLYHIRKDYAKTKKNEICSRISIYKSFCA